MSQILEAELQFTQSELKDVLQPNVLLSELQQLILQMLIEYTEYIQNNKETDRNRASKKRLIKLLDISVDLNGLGGLTASLKAQNKHLHSTVMSLKIKVNQLEKEINKHGMTFKEL